MQYMKYIYKIYPLISTVEQQINDAHFAVVLGAST